MLLMEYYSIGAGDYAIKLAPSYKQARKVNKRAVNKTGWHATLDKSLRKSLIASLLAPRQSPAALANSSCIFSFAIVDNGAHSTKWQYQGGLFGSQPRPFSSTMTSLSASGRRASELLIFTSSSLMFQAAVDDEAQNIVAVMLHLREIYIAW